MESTIYEAWLKYISMEDTMYIYLSSINLFKYTYFGTDT